MISQDDSLTDSTMLGERNLPSPQSGALCKNGTHRELDEKKGCDAGGAFPEKSPKTNDGMKHHEVTKIKTTVVAHQEDTDETEQTLEDEDFGFFPVDEDEDSHQGSLGSSSLRQSREGELGEEKRPSSGETEKEVGISSDVCTTTTNNDQSESTSEGVEEGRARNHSSPRRKKTSLRRGSSYGNDDRIPLDFERKEYNRVLPKPNLILLNAKKNQCHSDRTRVAGGSSCRGLFRISSEPVFVHPVYHEDGLNNGDTLGGSCNESLEGTTMKKRVSFGTIQIREHNQTIGDNPSCSGGTPVQLDWDYTEMQELNVEEYEQYKPAIRTKSEFHLNQFQRWNLLKLKGYSNLDIKEWKVRTDKLRNKRERTKYLALKMPAIGVVEEAIESSARKVKRSISFSR